MGRILTKEEFMESMASAAEDQELEEREKEMPADEENTEIEQEPEKKNVVKPRKKRTKKSAPVAAGQKKADEINEEAVREAIAKADRQSEALRAAVGLMKRFTEDLIEGAKYQVDMAEQYTGYSEILEDMI